MTAGPARAMLAGTMRALLLVLAVLVAMPVRAAPDAVLWPRWEAHDPAATTRLDHSAWDAFLAAWRRMGGDGIARVAYAEVTDAARGELAAYVARLEATPVSRLARAEQRAYWINLYNALTVRTVLAHYPVASIRDIAISPGLFARGPWGKRLVTVEGEGVSLDDIEHRILRPIWRDPRLHYALNCAALGCPDLPPAAFTAENSEALLEGAAAAYVNHPRGAELRDGRLTVSSIYVWYGADFGGERGVLAHLRRYAAPPLAAALAPATRLDAHRYDWALNDMPR